MGCAWEGEGVLGRGACAACAACCAACVLVFCECSCVRGAVCSVVLCCVVRCCVPGCVLLRCCALLCLEWVRVG